jgi:DNA-3-methyladenine glycosylase
LSLKLNYWKLSKPLTEKFSNRPTLAVARDLLGKFLVRRVGNRTIAAMIIEVEAYDGPHDKASHASRGMTKRNAPMFGPPGCWYIYFTYGMHWMLNIVTGPKGYPAAVLIRGVEGVSGPARVAKFFKIAKSTAKRINEKPASRATGLWIENRGIRIPTNRIRQSARIGVDYAGPVWARKKCRFVLK